MSGMKNDKLSPGKEPEAPKPATRTCSGDANTLVSQVPRHV